MREVWWYAAFLAVGSTPVALVLTYFTGSECSVEAYYSLSQIGAQSLAGVFNAICDTREITPLFFGFAIGAKVGCGLVAELGTMRVNEEIDALEVMGIPSKIYLVSTRMLACFIVLPFMYLLSLGISYVGSYVVQMYQIPAGTISSGVYGDYFYRFINVEDLAVLDDQGGGVRLPHCLCGRVLRLQRDRGCGRDRQSRGQDHGRLPRGDSCRERLTHAGLLGYQPQPAHSDLI